MHAEIPGDMHDRPGGLEHGPDRPLSYLHRAGGHQPDDVFAEGSTAWAAAVPLRPVHPPAASARHARTADSLSNAYTLTT
jgi:hypothetical protein